MVEVAVAMMETVEIAADSNSIAAVVAAAIKHKIVYPFIQ